MTYAGLPLETALRLLRQDGIEPDVEITRALRRTDDSVGELRVVRELDGGRTLTAARFDIRRDFSGDMSDNAEIT